MGTAAKVAGTARTPGAAIAARTTPSAALRTAPAAARTAPAAARTPGAANAARTTPATPLRTLLAAALLALLAAAALLALPGTAHAYNSAQNTAYNRSVAACNAYATPAGSTAVPYAEYTTATGTYAGCAKISVNVADLGLTDAQKQQVMDRLYANTDYWYIDACGDGKYTSTTLVYTCIYKSSAIPGMKAKLNTETAKALALIKGCTKPAEKVHMLHDWLVRNTADSAGTLADKLAYSCIVQHKADCMGFTYGMDYLLRKAGFTTAFAINMEDGSDHIWNMVRIGSSWFHVDVTWDHAWSYNKSKDLYWPNSVCHYWMLVSDFCLNTDEHSGWTVLKNGEAVSTPSARANNPKGAYTAHTYTYDDYYFNVNARKSFTWASPCEKKLAKGATFTVGKVKYQVTKAGAYVKVKAAAKKTVKSLVVPAQVWYRGHVYKVRGIAAKAFKKATKLKSITVKTALLTKANAGKALVGSKVKKVTVKGVAKKKKALYRKVFKRSGAKVSLVWK